MINRVVRRTVTALTRKNVLDLRQSILTEIREVNTTITNRVLGQNTSVFEKFSHFRSPERYKTQQEFLNNYENAWKNLNSDEQKGNELIVYDFYTPEKVIARFSDGTSEDEMQKEIAKALILKYIPMEKITQLYDGIVFHEVADLLIKHTGCSSASDYVADIEYFRIEM